MFLLQNRQDHSDLSGTQSSIPSGLVAFFDAILYEFYGHHRSLGNLLDRHTRCKESQYHLIHRFRYFDHITVGIEETDRSLSPGSFHKRVEFSEILISFQFCDKLVQSTLFEIEFKITFGIFARNTTVFRQVDPCFTCHHRKSVQDRIGTQICENSCFQNFCIKSFASFDIRNNDHCAFKFHNKSSFKYQ